MSQSISSTRSVAATSRETVSKPERLHHVHNHLTLNSDLEASEEASGHRRQSSLMSTSSEMPQMATTSMQSPMTPGSVSRPHSGAISIGSLVNPETLQRAYESYNGLGVHTTSTYPYLHGFHSSEDSLYYNTPESGLSPRSDEFVRHPHRQSMSSTSSVIDYPTSVTSPHIGNVLPSNWNPLPTPPTYLPATMGEENNMFAPVSLFCLFLLNLC